MSGAATGSGTTTTAAVPKAMGMAPEAYDGKPDKVQSFWSALENYFYLNDGSFADTNRKIATALTFFKMGTAAGAWAQNKQTAVLTASPVNFGTWNAFKTAFKDNLIPAQLELEATNLMYSQKMGTCDFNS